MSIYKDIANQQHRRQQQQRRQQKQIKKSLKMIAINGKPFSIQAHILSDIELVAKG